MIKLILACAGFVLLFDSVYYFVDHALNGFFLDWFMENCMRDHWEISEGQEMLVREPFWPYVKSMLIAFLCAAAVLLVLLVFAVSYFYAKAERKKAITEISRGIHASIRQEGTGQDIWKKEYEEVSEQMAEIRSMMRRHEQMLKEEAARKNDLITYLAHDLKTPLTSVIGYLSLLDEAPAGGAESEVCGHCAGQGAASGDADQ